MIYKGSTPLKLYKGNHHPAQLYKGSKKIEGYHLETQTGKSLTFNGTYNDTADVVVKGKSLQKSEWHKAEAQSTQSNPMINRVPEHMRKFEGWTAYQGASVTLTQNISVPEWGTDEATRIQITGGSHTTKYYYSMSAVIWGGSLPNSRKTQILIDVKNIGTAPVRISCNLGNMAIVNPGETKSVTVNGTGNGSNYWMFAFQALSASDNLDFIAYNPRAYILDEIPLPDNPFPIQTTIQAGTYKTQDYKGDWYEFTLDEDLHGIDDVRDSVEFDKYSHKGFLRKKTGKVVFDGSEILRNYVYYEETGLHKIEIPKPEDAGLISETWGKKILCSHELRKDNSLGAKPNIYQGTSTFVWTYDANAINATSIQDFKLWLAAQHAAGTPVTVVYQLATPTRTPLTFTLNNNSTAPECPMEFLTDTPSLEYPAEVFDASGTVKVANADNTQSQTAPIPPLRSNADGTVCDEFEVKTGKLTRKIGRIESYNGEDVGDDWISSTGALDTGATVVYALAEPIEEQHTPVTLPTYYPFTRIAQDGAVKGTIEARVKVVEG